MIHKIILKNFYSYDNEEINFAPGINAIIGNSRAGKTTVRRAIEWVLYNRPSGKNIISYWNRDKKNDPIDDSKIILDNNKCIIERYRNKNENCYDVDGKNYAAVKTNVPEDIEEALNFADVNIQKQFDQPFLLSDSAGEVARILNKTIRLDVIDAVLGKAESLRISKNREISKIISDIEQKEKEVEALSYIDDIEPFIVDGEKIEKELEELNDHRMKLEQFSSSIEQIRSVINNFPTNIDISISKIKEAVELYHDINNLVHNKSDLIRLKQNIEYQQDTIKQMDVLPEEVYYKAHDAVDLLKGQNVLLCEYEILSNLFLKIKRQKAMVHIAIDRIEEFEKTLPEKCPVCGQII